MWSKTHLTLLLLSLDGILCVSVAGEAWQHVSSLAKELTMCLLVLRPEDRPSCEEVLRHPWFIPHGGPSDCSLGELYHGRLKRLALMQRVKELFLNGGDIATQQELHTRQVHEAVARALAHYSTTPREQSLGIADENSHINRFLATLSLTGKDDVAGDDKKREYCRLESSVSVIEDLREEESVKSEMTSNLAVGIAPDEEFKSKVRSFKYKMMSSFSEEDSPKVRLIVPMSLYAHLFWLRFMITPLARSVAFHLKSSHPLSPMQASLSWQRKTYSECLMSAIQVSLCDNSIQLKNDNVVLNRFN